MTQRRSLVARVTSNRKLAGVIAYAVQKKFSLQTEVEKTQHDEGSTTVYDVLCPRVPTPADEAELRHFAAGVRWMFFHTGQDKE